MSADSVKTEDISLGNEPIGIWFVATRVTVVLLLMLAGILGNCLVLTIYGRDKKQVEAVYIIALALLDLFSCVFLLPQVPISELSVNSDWSLKVVMDKVYRTLSASCYYAYLFVQVAMALDQFIAVFRPFKYTRMRKKLNWWLFSVGALIIVIQISALIQPSNTIYRISLAFFVIILSMCFATLIGAYTATALKLYVQRRAIRPQTQRTDDIVLRAVTQATDAATTAQELARAEPAPPGKKRAMHIQALKIYTAILLVFVVTNLASAAIALLGMKWLTYVGYVSRTAAHPVIYYCFVEKFRSSVKEYWHRLTGC